MSLDKGPEESQSKYSKRDKAMAVLVWGVGQYFVYQAINDAIGQKDVAVFCLTGLGEIALALIVYRVLVSKKGVGPNGEEGGQVYSEPPPESVPGSDRRTKRMRQIDKFLDKIDQLQGVRRVSERALKRAKAIRDKTRKW